MFEKLRQRIFGTSFKKSPREQYEEAVAHSALLSSYIDNLNRYYYYTAFPRNVDWTDQAKRALFRLKLPARIATVNGELSTRIQAWQNDLAEMNRLRDVFAANTEAMEDDISSALLLRNLDDSIMSITNEVEGWFLIIRAANDESELYVKDSKRTPSWLTIRPASPACPSKKILLPG